MRPVRLLLRSLTYYRRTHAAVVLGVATAVSVLSGALIVGDSVRSSLRDLFVGRLGRADLAISAPRFFREALASELASHPGFEAAFEAACPMIVLEGVVTHEASGRRASRVRVYGVDASFWAFHGLAVSAGDAGGGVGASASLASELGAALGDTLLVRVPRPAAVSASTLFGRKDDLARTLRLSLGRVLPSGGVGEFSLRPQQQPVPAIFVPMARLQRSLDQPGKANTVLLSERRPPTRPDATAAAATVLRERIGLADLGLRLRVLEGPGVLSLESESALLSEREVRAARAAAQRLGLSASPVLTYLASVLRVGDRAIPYSLVAAVEPDTLPALGAEVPKDSPPPIVLNEWTARDLGARPGDRVFLDYYVWQEQGSLETRTAELEVAAVVPIEGVAADRDFAPEYPGITGSEHLSDWDPPFPIDLRRIRPQDEEYWKRYRTTPKAFVRLATGQELWRHRLGAVTSIRLRPPAGTDLAAAALACDEALRAELDPLRAGFLVDPVRAAGESASRGSTDFGEYFAYFSSFLVFSALLLGSLFFRLGLEQRQKEIGLLRAVGFSGSRLRRWFVAEGALLAILGGALGMAGAWGYAALMVHGLRTWWVDAVGTRDIVVHVTTRSLAIGGLGGIAAAVAAVALTLRGLRRVSPRKLLAGTPDTGASARPGTEAPALGHAALVALVAGLASVVLVVAAMAGVVGDVPGFFGSGLLLLICGLAMEWRWLSSPRRATLTSRGALGLARLGARSASDRPGRSLLCIALIAAATFVIVAVGAFRRDSGPEVTDRSSGSGGFGLIAESLVPLHHDPNTPEGKEALGLASADAGVLRDVRFARLRLRAGEDASCLNMYRPGDPRIAAVAPDLAADGRFSFRSSLARTPEAKANPWRLLDTEYPDGAIPVVADANSMEYVLHRKLGEDVVLSRAGMEPTRLRLVAALRDSVFQGELLMSEAHFLRLFPEEAGYRLFLIEAQPTALGEVTRVLESRLSDQGLDVVSTAERLASFHRVENTYLSTFQTLGALGLVLGTVGLGTVLVRNVLERRRELALLRAVGYRGSHLSLMVTAENALLLVLGLGTGAISALLAIAPTVLDRGGRLPILSLMALLMAVLATGLVVSRLAIAVMHRSPLLQALREE